MTRGPEPNRRPLATGAGVTVGATLLMGGVAQAACTCNVDSLADPTALGHTTLRDAVTSAQANPGSTITFASGLSGTITLGKHPPRHHPGDHDPGSRRRAADDQWQRRS